MQPKIGVFAKHISRPTPEELFDAVAGYGFDCTQFNAACLGLPNLPDQIDNALWSRAALAARCAGVRIVALSATFNLLDENKVRLAGNFQRLAVLAEGAAILGTDLLTLCSGTRHQVDMWKYDPENQSPAAWQEMIEGMRQALEVAIKYDLCLGIEPEVANVVSNANDAARLIKELGSDRVRIVFDPANLYRPPADPRRDQHIVTDALRLLGDRVAIAHCKDIAVPGTAGTPLEPGEARYTHVAAGTGILDYGHYISELRRLVSAEIPLILHGLPEKQIPDSVEFIQRYAGEPGTCRPLRLAEHVCILFRRGEI